ncbi:MAG: hypothetical protein ACXVJN_07170 [Mucilaginibacter sp.]
MRLITIILSLFLCATLTRCFCADVTFRSDTVKHRIKKKYKQPSPLELISRHKDYYDDCVFVNKYSIAQRLKKYPYSKAVKILAVSYHVWGGPDADIRLETEEIKPKTKDTTGLQIINDSLDYSKLIEVKKLNKQQVNRLTNIIFNTDYKVIDYINEDDPNGCFNPRNALIFFDRNGKVFDYIEICFECNTFYSKSERIQIGTKCIQKYALLKKYFISLGIKYGTLTKEKSE